LVRILMADIACGPKSAGSGSERTHSTASSAAGEERFFAVVLGGVAAFGGGYDLARIRAFSASMESKRL
jgi:hypothetical protein